MRSQRLWSEWRWWADVTLWSSPGCCKTFDDSLLMFVPGWSFHRSWGPEQSEPEKSEEILCVWQFFSPGHNGYSGRWGGRGGGTGAGGRIQTNKVTILTRPAEHQILMILILLLKAGTSLNYSETLKAKSHLSLLSVEQWTLFNLHIVIF